MSSLILKAEFAPSTTIQEAVSDAQEFAKKMDIKGVSFLFNGIELFVHPGPAPESFVDNYYFMLERRKNAERDEMYRRYDI